MIRSSHRSSNKEKSQFSIIFVLAKVDPPPSGAPCAMSLTAKWSTTLA